jgi:hypothetical protein
VPAHLVEQQLLSASSGQQHAQQVACIQICQLPR